MVKLGHSGQLTAYLSCLHSQFERLRSKLDDPLRVAAVLSVVKLGQL
jgi:hypothetical protein